MSIQLEAEVRSLQSQLVRMRRTHTLVALALLAVGLVAGSKPAGVVQAQRLEIVDTDGQVQATFEYLGGGTQLQMAGSDGAIVTLRAFDGHTDLFMRTNGSMTTAPAVALSGDKEISKLQLADPHGNPRVALGTEGNNQWVRTVDITGLVRTELTAAAAPAATP